MSDGCGPPPSTPFAVFGPDGSCSRIRQLSLLSTEENPSDGSSPRWPKWATWDGGAVYERRTWERPTDASGCSLLPTPAAQEPGGTVERHLWRKNRLDGANRVTPTHLSLAVQLLPTPTTSDAKGPSPGHGGTTAEAIALLPTPSAANPNDGEDLENWQRRRDEQLALGRNGNGFGTPLATVRLLPTPRAADAKACRNTTANRSPGAMGYHSGDTLTDALVPSSGAPTSPPSGDGRPSTEQPPTLWTDEDG